MQTEHLFELTYILLERKNVTAQELAEHFEVSTRTIYRWIDALDLAGVPVITSKGKGGGISISEKYVLDKAVLTEEEKLEILSSVQAFEVLSGNKNTAASKLKAITKANADWIKIDFAPWNPKSVEVRELFNLLKSSILNQKQIEFEYFSSKGDCEKRKVDPWKIIFRGQAWYLHGFCNTKKEGRIFKLSRMQNCTILASEIKVRESDVFEKSGVENGGYEGDRTDNVKVTRFKLLVRDTSVYRILDEYQVVKIQKGTSKGSKIIVVELPEMYWLKNWFLSFGAELKILEPLEYRNLIEGEARKMAGLE